MTARDLLADGKLTDAIAAQQDAADPAGRLFLAELLAVADRFAEAREVLLGIDSDDPSWPASRKRFRRIIAAARKRANRRKPELPTGVPVHARRRWGVIRAIRNDDGSAAADGVDRADAASPFLSGHIDGREFDGVRDSDDRFGSVLEAFVGSAYVWLPWERIRLVHLLPAVGVLDAAYRPARITLHTGDEWAATVPLTYPDSAAAGDDFALAADTDWLDVPGGVAVAVGAKVLMIGDDDLLLKDVTRIEISRR